MYRYFTVEEVLKNGYIMQWELNGPDHVSVERMQPVGVLKVTGPFQMVYKAKDETTKRILLSAWPRSEMKKKYESDGE